MNSFTTPMMVQYKKEKERLKDHLLFFRVGDFFELFFEDAIRGSRLLDITLTKRQGVIMCGVPAQVINTYIKRLLKQGVKVAICDQKTSARKGMLVEREVVEQISPGTISDLEYLEDPSHNYLMVVQKNNDQYACCWIDISTGDFSARVMDAVHDTLYATILNLRPRELIISEREQNSLAMQQLKKEFEGLCVTVLHDWFFSKEEGVKLLQETLGVVNLKYLDLEEKNSILLSPISALLQYIQMNNTRVTKRIHTLNIRNSQNFMVLDPDSIYNLELYSSIKEKKTEHSLLHILNSTTTRMGIRALTQWLMYPLLEKKKIEERQERVQFFLEHEEIAAEIRLLLKNIYDMPRLLTRITTLKAHSQDLLFLGSSIDNSLEIIRKLREAKKIFSFYNEENVGRSGEMVAKIHAAINDEAPIQIGSGYVIRPQYDEELDSLRYTYENVREILRNYQNKEQSTFAATLRLKNNRVLGYYFEISQKMKGTVPDHFILRQTISNSCRYKTTELAKIESEILNVESKLFEREESLFSKLVESLVPFIHDVSNLAFFIAEIDVLLSFSENAKRYDYVRPKICDSNVLHIESGRHPVIEFYNKSEDFIPNDLVLGAENDTFCMLTAPNMAGKSTYLRQNALMVIMAQMGSFIPAKSAEIGIRDKIFCRVGASDNLIRGHSTFLLEMSETAYIIQNANEKSFVIMDEIGRGTSTHDGQSLAHAIAEYFLEKKIFTVFATHFHELTALDFPNLQRRTISITMYEDRIVFKRKLIEGVAERSYGIEVAELAGLNKNVLIRAKEILKGLEKTTQVRSLDVRNEEGAKQETSCLYQLGKDPAQRELVEKEFMAIIDTNLEQTTPLEAQVLLYKLQGLLKQK